MNPRTALLGAATSALVLLGTVGAATAGSAAQDGIDSHAAATAAIDDGQRMVDTGQAKIQAGRDWFAANPPPTTDPPPAQGEVSVDATATVVDGRRARVDWTVTGDVTGWWIGRDGVDTSGTGAWSTTLPAPARTFTFDLLRAGGTYRFTLVPKTTRGDLPPVVTQVTMPGAATPPPTTEQPPPAPAPGTGGTAAERFGWGAPIAAGSDEFSYTGRPDPAKWVPAGECWAGHAGNGRRCASRSTVDGGKLVQTGLANGDTAWLGSRLNQRYGRWEARVRSSDTGASRFRYHPLLIIWPSSNRFPQEGEYDFLENGVPGAACAEAFIHYPHGPGATQQEFARETNCGSPLSGWHNVAIEWTPRHVKGFIDGREWFSFSDGARPGRQNIQDMPSGALKIQLDGFHGTGPYRPATYEVDWVRTYPLR